MSLQSLSISRDVYIPLCLYFNKRWTCTAHWCVIVYIPLCLYFNIKGVANVFLSWLFTFHYVSILIFYGKGIFHAAYAFTFHYVSILIRRRGLYRPADQVYIPLCLYFNVSAPVIACGFFNSLHSIMSLF